MDDGCQETEEVEKRGTFLFSETVGSADPEFGLLFGISLYSACCAPSSKSTKSLLPSELYRSKLNTNIVAQNQEWHKA